jgi:hypothetical protein
MHNPSSDPETLSTNQTARIEPRRAAEIILKALRTEGAHRIIATITDDPTDSINLLVNLYNGSKDGEVWVVELDRDGKSYTAFINGHRSLAYWMSSEGLANLSDSSAKMTPLELYFYLKDEAYTEQMCKTAKYPTHVSFLETLSTTPPSHLEKV